MKEITERILTQGLWESNGKTPDNTIAAALYTDIKRYGDNSVFKKASPGKFTVQIESIGIDEPILVYSFSECALKVLEENDSKEPMHYKEITAKALEKGWLVTEGKTPESTMYAQIITEIKRYKGSGRSPRFVQHGNGLIGLSNWVSRGVVSEIEQYNKQTRKALLAKLHSMNPVDFEDLISRLLTAMGFEMVEVTRYSGDGGIDVRGVLVIGDVIRIKMAVQAKRWKSNVQSPAVQQLRGSLGAHEQGLIITTSDFSKGASNEAIQADKTPIALMNGNQLVTLLMEYSIGVQRTPQVLFDLDESFKYDNSM